ncbi:MAG: S1 family peptidase [Phycisphaerales bacterium]
MRNRDRNRLVNVCVMLLIAAVTMAGFAHVAVAQDNTLSDAAERALDSVFLVGVEHEDGTFVEVGTAWTIAPNRLATNAHVAYALIAESLEGGRMIARRGLLDQAEIVLSDPVIHPAYDTWNPRLARMLVGAAAQLKNFNVIAVADVAVIDVIAGDAGTPLLCADAMDEASAPKLGADVMYVGYPAENLSGFTTLHAVRGTVTAKTDFFFTRATWGDCQLIHFAGPATGGASGSPVFGPDGKIIGILSAAEHLQVNENVRASFGFTYAQRIDLALELVDGTADAKQHARNRAWQQKAYDLFVKPETLVRELIAIRAAALSVDPSAYQRVTARTDTLANDETTQRVRVVLEPGYQYGFLAVAHDATDIDMVVVDSANVQLGIDESQDQFPVVWIEAVDQRKEVFADVTAYEPLLGPTPITLEIVRINAAMIAAANIAEMPEFMQTPAGDRIFDSSYVVEAENQSVKELEFQLEAGKVYTFRAFSPDQLDIDLRVTQGGSLLGEDVLIDWYPEVQVTGATGSVTLVLVLPAGTPAASEVHLTVDERVE